MILRKVLNLINPDEPIRKVLSGSYTSCISFFKYLISDKPLSYADLIILSFENFAMIKEYTEFSYIPFLMYGNVDYIDRAFSLGASDYIKRPFCLPELDARAQKIIRINQFSHNDLLFKFSQTYIECRSNFEPLSDKEFQLLTLLVGNSGNIVSRDGINYRLELGKDKTRALDVYINSLRKKISTVSGCAEMGGFVICTVRGKGYTINSQIKCG